MSAISDDAPEQRLQIKTLVDEGNSNTKFLRVYRVDLDNGVTIYSDINFDGSSYSVVGPVAEPECGQESIDHGDLTGLGDDDHPFYKDRANHTGTQLASTISDFNSAVYSALDGDYISTDTLITTSSTTFQTAQTLTYTIPSGGGKYLIEWYYEWTHETTSDDFECLITVDGTTVSDHREEPQDSGTDQFRPVSGFVEQDLTAGSKTILIKFRTDDSGETSYIRRRRLRIRRLS